MRSSLRLRLPQGVPGVLPLQPPDVQGGIDAFRIQLGDEAVITADQLGEWEFYRDLTEVGGYEMETAGVLKGGRKVWALARTGKQAVLKGSDTVNG